jgi:anti-anti-sigma regulatory factor
MGVQCWSQDIVIVQLPPEPHTSNELETVIDTTFERPGCDVILDFSRVRRVTCLTLCQLTKLQKTLTCSGRRLAFCQVAPITRDIFEAIGFDRIFEQTQEGVIALETGQGKEPGGTIELRNDKSGKQIERRNYFRLDLSQLNVKALLWHQSLENGNRQAFPEQYWQGDLIDISEGGAKIRVRTDQSPDLQKEQFVRLVLTETPIDKTLTLDAKTREVLPEQDDSSISVGLQFIGLEANPEGREGLQQLCDSMARYYEAPQPVST